MSTCEVIRCAHCQMPLLSVREYHPHGACLMYRGCGDAQEVRCNLAIIVGTGDCRRVAAEIHETLMSMRPSSLQAVKYLHMEEGALRCISVLESR